MLDPDRPRQPAKPDGMPVYRRLTLADMPALAALQCAYKAAIEEAPPTGPDFERLSWAIKEGHILFYGALAEEKLIATCSVSLGFSTFDYQTSGVFEDFYVSPPWRGRGVARRLAAFARTDSGVSTLTVGCADCDRAMYEALGFRTCLGHLLAWKDA